SAQTDTAQPLPARNELARRIAAIWQRVLDVPRVGFDDNFFDLGGNSLSGMQLIAELRRELHVQIAPVTLFEAPTVNALTAHLSPEIHQSASQPSAPTRSVRLPAEDQQAIAIIGMTGRFPGAQNVEAFWQNLRDGVESITFFDDDQLSEAGIPAALLDDPNYVKARPVIGDAAAFDAGFFGYTPREAELMDPQQRIFLECAWEALEQTGYATTAYPGAIGVFAGASISTYLLGLYTDPAFVASIDPLQTIIGNDKDSLATTVSYKFNLKGPSLTVQTYCSTSLVAVHLARQSLLRGECDVALAGGVSIVVPQASGYHYQEEGIVSPDGHCRTFDASAAGTLFGNGAGIVVLKRLEDALSDGDTIHAVVRGTAINNDGAHKVGYTAPSVDGQAAVIRAALNDAGVSADSIDYIEAHGTGTALGDPIEITALTKAFRADTAETGYCAIGSVKTNIGHLDRAAGVAALIKTVLALKHQQLPPSLHFEQPNPRIDFANSPFYVNANLAAWEARQHPRRAGVSALGFGGTNAHIILEEAPPTTSAPAEAWHLLTLSARTTTALDQASLDLAAYLRQHPDANLSDVAYTLQVGRKAFVERRVVVCRTADEAVSALEGHDPQQLLSGSAAPVERPVVFLFPGQGAQYRNMARDLYAHAPVFRQHVDRCADILKPHLDADLRDVLWSDAAQLDQTIYTQPAIFVIEYALAQLWISWGLKPQAMLGHSLGEYVAACLAGVFSLEDGLKLVARRGQLMQHMPPGSMVSVSLSEAELMLYLQGTPEISLAAINGPERCVVAGPAAAVAALVERLERMDVACRALHTDRAFHSIHIDQIAQEFRAALEDVELHAPQIPYLSNLTGRPITAAEATDHGYWLRQMREPVRFSDCVAELAQDNSRIFLEVGPGTTLSGLVRQHDRQLTTLASLRHRDDSRDDLAFMLTTLGRLWMTGAPVEWLGLYSIGPRRRIPLPTYPFERQNYWLSSQRLMPTARPQVSTSKLKNIADWFYVPTWQHTPVPALPTRASLAATPRVWLILSDVHGIGPAIGQQLREAEHEVIFVTVGEQFRRLDNGLYELNPRQTEDYAALLADLRQHSQEPTEILHLWSLSDDEQPKDWHVEFDTAQTYGFYSLLYLIQALGKRGSQTPLQLSVVSNQVYSVTPAEPIRRAKTTLLGMCKVIPQEYPTISCRYIDLALPNRSRSAQVATQLVAEVLTPATNPDIAYRGAQRWVQDFEPVRLEGGSDPLAPIRPEGVYLLTGGLAEIGFALTEYLATTAKARLVLIEPGAFPENDLWEQWLATHSDQHSVSRKIYRLQALIAGGAQILVINSSLTNTHELAAAVERATQQFGAINGVIHAATVVGEQAFRALQETTPEECEWHFAAKARSLFALEAVFRDHDLDFCLLVSSLAAFLGGRGYAAYAAANRFMDAFAQRHNQTSDQLWTSVNWDAWQIEDGRMTAMSQSLSALAMTPDEGGTALRRIVAWNAADQVLVSTAPLAPRIEELQQQAGALRASLISDDAAPATAYPRPQLPTAYIAPETELEQKIAAIWRRSLGFEQIGVYDNFFELGGDSLIAIRVVAQMKSELQIELSVVSLYERLTIKALAEFLEQGGDNPPDLVQADDQESKINRRKQYRQTKRSGK
ncbi:MAG: acyltransferase domain-containing protein, partial [Chloroflexi bacterium]|nr:acyltransferase domain-containing protein [Chloroflexota bacterium]